MNLKAVIFDFDGLLVDTEIVSYRIYKELLKPYGCSFEMKEYSDHYSGKTEINNVTQLIENYDLDWSIEEGLDRVLEKEKEILSEGVELKKGARELLSYLKQNKYLTAIATSSTKDRAMDILEDNGIADLFDEFVFAEDIQRSKPDPEVFLKAAEKLKAKPEECLVLEDSQTGIEAAVRAHMSVICIPDMKKPDDEHLKQTIAVKEDLLSVIDFLQQ